MSGLACHRLGVVRFASRCSGVLLTLLAAEVATAQLRVVSYNTTGAPYNDAQMAIVLRSIGEEIRNGIARPIDVLLLQETSRDPGLPDTQAFVDLLNAMYAGQMFNGRPITYARGNAIGNASFFMDTGQSIVYRTQTVELLGEALVGNVSGSGQPRSAMRYHMRPVGYDSTEAEFYAYNSHFKAGDTTTDENRRNAEAINIRNNANALGNAHIIYAGDLNLYTAGEPAFQTLLAPGNGKAIDPLGLTDFDDNPGTFLSGEWHENFASSFSHTQSPCASSINGCGVGGGMDDRFDFQLITEEFDDGEGLSIVPNSYHAFGNGGGFCCNSSITTGSNPVTFPGVTSHSRIDILTALRDLTDHIPVVVDYQVPAVLEATIASVPSMLHVGQAFNLELTVRNGADVVAPNGADELDYSVTTDPLGAVSGSFFDQMDLALGDGNVHLLPLDTATPGMKTGTILVQSGSQGVQNSLIEIPISYLVQNPVLQGDFNNDGRVDAGDYVRWRNHLGEPDETNISFAGDGGDVGLGDYSLWKTSYGNPSGGGGSVIHGDSPGANYAVPEPSGWLLAAIGCCLVAGRRGTLTAWTRKT